VKLTKGDQVYTEQLKVVLDPRAKYSLEERKRAVRSFDEGLQVAGAHDLRVDAIEGVGRGQSPAAKLPEKDPLRKQLERLAADCDALRSKIVATKEGGMITGEDASARLLGQLYRRWTGYDGKPTDYQVARTESLGHELEDVIVDFQKLAQKELPAVNAALQKKKLGTIPVLAEADWQKKKGSSHRFCRAVQACWCGTGRGPLAERD